MMIAAIVLNWNNFEDTKACLDRLLNINEFTTIRVVLLDNASTDGSFERLVDIFKDQVILIQNSSNLGFGGGMNLGLQWASENGFKYAAIINNDASVTQNDLKLLMDVSEKNPLCGIIAPRINSTYDHSYIWGTGFRLDRLSMGIRRIPEDMGRLGAVSVDYVSGCIMLLRLDVFRGKYFFDPDFFMYFEDAEICSRIRSWGWQILYCPEVQCAHRIMPGIKNRITPFVFYHLGLGRILWLRKCFSGWPKYYGLITHFVLFTPFRLAQSMMAGAGLEPFIAWMKGTWNGMRLSPKCPTRL